MCIQDALKGILMNHLLFNIMLHNEFKIFNSINVAVYKVLI